MRVIAEMDARHTRESKEMEARFGAAHRELAEIYERKVAELREELADANDRLEQANSTISRLKSQQTASIHDDAVMNETMASMGRRMTSEIEERLEKRLETKTQATARTEATDVVNAANKTQKIWSGIIGTVAAGVTVGALTFLSKACGYDPPTGKDLNGLPGVSAPTLKPSDPNKPHGMP